MGLLDRYLEGLTGRVLRDADCVLGSFTAGAELIKSRFEAYGKFPVKRRLQMIADDLHSRFSSRPGAGRRGAGRPDRFKGPERTAERQEHPGPLQGLLPVAGPARAAGPAGQENAGVGRCVPFPVSPRRL